MYLSKRGVAFFEYTDSSSVFYNNYRKQSLINRKRAKTSQLKPENPSLFKVHSMRDYSSAEREPETPAFVPRKKNRF